MATKKEKEQLVEVLKFTPRTYNVGIYGYGGEIAMGKIKPETVDYFKQNLISVENYAYTWADEGDDDYIEVPEDLQPFQQGSWYDCDGIEHCSGAEFGGCRIEVRDENGNTVWEEDLDYNLEDLGCVVEQFCSEDIDDYVNKDQAVFVGQSFEKGTFFDAELELREPFDPAKFKFTYSDVAGWSILNLVEYAGDELDGSGGYSTTGKSSDFNFYYQGTHGEVETYNSPSDEDYGVPEYGPSPSDWEKSPKFKFKQHKPVHVGWYSVNWGYGNTYGTLYWNGENFVEFNYGKETVIDPKGIVTWQGYDWDTSSWDNQPPEPFDVICSDKKCGWVGKGQDRIEDDDYNDHCPKCNGTEFDWIDYDPDTAKGRKNREKYCLPALPKISNTSTKFNFDQHKPERVGVYDVTWKPDAYTTSYGQVLWNGKEFVEVIHNKEHPITNPVEWQECNQTASEEDLLQALDELKEEFDQLSDVECVQCEWRGTVDETNDDDGEMVCPECGEPVEFYEPVVINTNPWIDVKTPPAVEGSYEVKNTHTPVWPFPAWFEATWNGKAWVDSDGDPVENVIEWREL